MDERTRVSQVPWPSGQELRVPLLEATAPPAASASGPLAETVVRPEGLDDPTPRDLDRTTASGPGGDDPPETVRQLGRYLIIKQLGAGGMGVVYKAYDPDLDRKVAIKLLRGPVTSDARARLLREAQAMAKLSHPSVVPVFDVGSHGEQVFVAMDYVDGTDLRAWLQTRRPWTDVVDAFAQAGAGLAAAHAVGLIHRDFKPDNVLLSTDPATGRLRAQVADFGLARLGDEGSDASARRLELSRSSVLEAHLTHHGAILGTPAYMSPEQHAGLVVDARSDQFSFCVALFEALYGKRPFTGATMEELALRALDTRREPPPARTDVPPALHRVCLRGLQPDREARYPRMDALLADLLAGRTRVRRRWLGVAAALGVLATAGGLVLAARGPGLCEGGPARLAGVWDDTRRAAAEQAFRATELPYAEGAWRGAAGLLDRYAADWTATYTEACTATQIRGEQSAELMDLRMVCLQRRLQDLGALVDMFQRADKQIVGRAADAAIALPSLAPCSDVDALRSGALAPRAEDPARAEALRAEIKAARALALGGKAREAIPAMQPLVAEAAALGDPSLAAWARLTLGRTRAGASDDAAARDDITAALWRAIADRDDETAWDALIQQVWVVGYKLQRRAEAQPWIDHAQALLERRGRPPEAESQLLEHIGMAEIAAGDYAKAEPLLARSVALLEPIVGDDHPRLVGPLNAQGAALLRSGRYAEAQARFTRAVAIAETARGSDHPDLAHPLNNLALAYERQNRYTDAIAALRRTLAILEGASGKDHPNAGLVRQNIGGMLRLAGQLEAARVELDAAQGILERSLGPEHPALGGALTFRGDVARDLGDLPGARAYYQRSLEIRGAALGEAHPDLALSLLGLAELDLAEDKPRDALPRLDHALKNMSSTTPDPGDLGLAHFARARALAATGADPREAAAAARAALLESGVAGRRALAELDAWLAARPGPDAPPQPP